MNEFTLRAIEHLKNQWHSACLSGGREAADLLGIKVNTLKTRIARGQAMVMRNQDGNSGRSLDFTGFHLVYNLIADRALRFGLPIDSDDEQCEPGILAEWVFNNVLSGPMYSNAAMIVRRDESGLVSAFIQADGQIEECPREPVLYVPLANMVIDLAGGLQIRAMSKVEIHAALANA